MENFYLKEAIAELFPQIEQALKKGYSDEEAAELFHTSKIEIDAATLKKYSRKLRLVVASNTLVEMPDDL